MLICVQKTVGFLANFTKIRYYIKNNEKFFGDNMHFDIKIQRKEDTI